MESNQSPRTYVLDAVASIACIPCFLFCDDARDRLDEAGRPATLAVFMAMERAAAAASSLDHACMGGCSPAGVRLIWYVCKRAHPVGMATHNLLLNYIVVAADRSRCMELSTLSVQPRYVVGKQADQQHASITRSPWPTPHFIDSASASSC
jgi:hypothetical protein